MKNIEKTKIDLLKESHNYPFQNWNLDIDEYIKLNLFWLSFMCQFNLKDWEYGLSYYVNFDDEDDRDFSTDVIFIKNLSLLKMIAISPITNYEKQFSDTKYYIGIFKDDDNSEKEYDMLSIGIDLKEEKYLPSTEKFINYFLSKDYNFEDMEKMIEKFNNSL